QYPHEIEQSISTSN
ncbi:unnamed protein product, partial [Rotaria magnacalcarata]